MRAEPNAVPPSQSSEKPRHAIVQPRTAAPESPSSVSTSTSRPSSCRPWSWPSPGTPLRGSCAACLHGCVSAWPHTHRPGTAAPPRPRPSQMRTTADAATHNCHRDIHTLLPASLLDLCRETVPHEPVAGLDLLRGLEGVVDERKAGALAAAVLRAETKNADGVLGRLVHLAQALAQLVLADVGPVRVQHVDDHLLALQQRVADELARAQRHLALGHCGCVCGRLCYGLWFCFYRRWKLVAVRSAMNVVIRGSCCVEAVREAAVGSLTGCNQGAIPSVPSSMYDSTSGEVE